MPTLIFTPRYTEDGQALWKAAAALGWTTERLASWRIPDHLCQLPEPVLYVEALFGPTLAEQLGASLLTPPDDWLVRLPAEHRRREIALTTLGLARTNPAPAFVKPPSDKSFPAAVYRGSELPADFDDAMPVLVSEVVAWTLEFRAFVLDRTLRAYSLYARDGEPQRENDYRSTPDEDAEMEKFITALLADTRVDLPRATVVDVGLIAGRGWACVEQNGAWGAGIYGCDPSAVLQVVRRATTKESPGAG